MIYKSTAEFAREQDEKDSLQKFRKKFYIPVRNGRESIYFCGNSLGLQPKDAEFFLQNEMNSWRDNGVEGHFSEDSPWVDYHQLTKKSLTNLLGAKELEVASMGSLTSNLHLLLASFYQPSGKRVKVMIEAGAFPSDHYVAESHMRRMGVDPSEHLIVLTPKTGHTFSTSELVEAIGEAGDELALLFFPGVQYYTGQFFDLKELAKAAHEVGAFAGFDLAHAVGNLPLSLHDDDADFAAWCSYKYMNSGPGGVSGLFVHEKHCMNPAFPKLTGWWGHQRKSRFQMDNQFVPNIGADAWMLSNANILSMAVHRASLAIFDRTSMAELRKKSIGLTGYLEFLLMADPVVKDFIEIITPQARGCQLSIFLANEGKKIFDGLIDAGVILDWREPNVIRVAPTPLYNTYSEVWEFYQILKALISKHGGMF